MAKNDESRHYGGRGDPIRSMQLMWGDGPAPRSRGPKQGLTVDRIVRAGIEIADADGLAALSMRRVAERLGVGTMSLYTYVPAKAELVDVMYDRAVGTVDPPEVTGGWREKLSAEAWSTW
ncbi:MAG: TetR/AcrR family transcriptional regulator, partial [Pseudonocardiaceae bacterium]|nr:TetR/AcrR family transcriptional regulator [Pseudonocardiaceae bacterium]